MAAPDPDHPLTRPFVGPLGVLVTGCVGFGLGGLTSFAQAWLPDGTRSLANSSGSWALTAFALALLASSPRAAAARATLTLAMLLGGYVVTAGVRGMASSNALITFWGLAAVTAGPCLGLAASWLRDRRPRLAPVGLGAIAGVLVGEGSYGLLVISDTTSPSFWIGEIVVGVALLFTVGIRRLTDIGARALAVAVTLVTALAFLVIYRLDLIGL